MTPANLKRLGKLWQKRLNLLDWTIEFRLEAIENEPETLGLSIWDSDSRHARIFVALDQGHGTHEETLIHELLHIVFEGHRSDASQHDVNVERSINAVAHALHVAYRGRKEQ